MNHTAVKGGNMAMEGHVEDSLASGAGSLLQRAGNCNQLFDFNLRPIDFSLSDSPAIRFQGRRPQIPLTIIEIICSSHILSCLQSPSSSSPSSRGLLLAIMDARKRKRTSEEEERAGKSTFQCDELCDTGQNMNPVEFQKEYENVNYDKSVQVKALQKAASWQPLSENQIRNIVMRVGSQFPPLSIACFDRYNNCMQFPSMLQICMQLQSSKDITFDVSNKKIVMSSDRLTMTVKDVRVVCSELDSIRPSYNATMRLSPIGELFSVTIPFKVLPGAPRRVVLDSSSFMKELVPGEIIEGMVLEVFDEYNNHVQENELISLQLDGLCVQDGRSLTFKANKDGFVDLSGILKVVKGFGQRGSFSVYSDDQKIFEKSFQTEGRELRTAFQIPFITTAGSRLKNIAFEVIKENGEVDEGIHGEGENGDSHSLTFSSDSFELDSSVKYSFIHGRCTVQEIPLPCKEGKFYFRAAHSHHPELNLNLELHMLKPKHTPGQILDELTADILQNGSCIGRLENKIILLIRQQSILEEAIASLQECLNPVDSNASKLVSEQESVEIQFPVSPMAIHSPGESGFAMQMEGKKKELQAVTDKLARVRAEREDALNTFSKQERMFRSLVAYNNSLREVDQTKGRDMIYIDDVHRLGIDRMPSWYSRF